MTSRRGPAGRSARHRSSGRIAIFPVANRMGFPDTLCPGSSSAQPVPRKARRPGAGSPQNAAIRRTAAYGAATTSSYRSRRTGTPRSRWNAAFWPFHWAAATAGEYRVM